MKKNTGKTVISLLLVLCLAAGLCGCTTYNNFKAAFFSSGDKQAEQTIKIAIYESLSGKNKAQGEAEVKGIELAHELYGEVLGKKIELIYGDNQSSMYVGETVIQELISQSPSVILGSCGEVVSLVASDYIKAAGIPAITISANNPLLTANNEYYFTGTFTETRQGDALADFAYTQRGKDKVATVRIENDDTATATIKRFTNRVKKLSGSAQSIVGSYTLTQDTKDFTEVIEQLRTSGATALFLAVPPTTAQAFLEQAIAQQMTHLLYLGGRSWNDEAYLKFVNKQERLEIAYPSDFSQKVRTGMSDVFLSAYKEKYGEYAEPEEATAIAFDAYLLAVEAIKNAQATMLTVTDEELAEQNTTDATLKAAREEVENAKKTGIPGGKQIKTALSAINNFEGASGVISYNGKNEASKTISINYILNGMQMSTYTDNMQNIASVKAADPTAKK